MTADEVVRRLRAFECGKPMPRGETLRVSRVPDEQAMILAFVKMTSPRWSPSSARRC
jgi:hypothetical protein